MFAIKEGRGDIMHRLAHQYLDDLESRYLFRIDRNITSVSALLGLLGRYGAKTEGECWMMSDIECLDGRMALLRDALEESLDWTCALVLSCIPGRLCYFQAEDLSGRDRFIIFRKE